jgi:hypothetical protein
MPDAMKTFSIVFVTARDNPKFGWMASVANEIKRRLNYSPPIIVVSRNPIAGVPTHQPKPTIWQGEHRVTKENWWAISNARNTGICLCQTEYICFFDDRCVVAPGYVDALTDAMEGGYAMAGAYQKRINMKAVAASIVNEGQLIGEDSRVEHMVKNNLVNPLPIGADWFFGANCAMPLEWALQVNGYPEIADGVGFEDVLFGLLLFNNGLPMKFDRRALVIQDRTPGQIGPTYIRRDKGRDKGNKEEEKAYKLLRMFQNKACKTAKHVPGWDINLRQIRAEVLAGKPFPAPPAVEFKDFYDNQPIREFE